MMNTILYVIQTSYTAVRESEITLLTHAVAHDDTHANSEPPTRPYDIGLLL